MQTLPKCSRVAALIALLAAGVSHAVAQTRPLVTQYCVGCHSQKARMAGISLEGLDPSKPGENAAVWEKVLRKVNAGQMPPAGLPRPSAAAAAAFTKSLGEELDRAAAANPNPGNPTIHRLNRAEYSNAVRDLLALDIKPGRNSPPTTPATASTISATFSPSPPSSSNATCPSPAWSAVSPSATPASSRR